MAQSNIPPINFPSPDLPFRPKVVVVAVPALGANAQDDGIIIPAPFTPRASFVMAQFKGFTSAGIAIVGATMAGDDVQLCVQAGANAYGGGNVEVTLFGL